MWSFSIKLFLHLQQKRKRKKSREPWILFLLPLIQPGHLKEEKKCLFSLHADACSQMFHIRNRSAKGVRERCGNCFCSREWAQGHRQKRSEVRDEGRGLWHAADFWVMFKQTFLFTLLCNDALWLMQRDFFSLPQLISIILNVLEYNYFERIYNCYNI